MTTPKEDQNTPTPTLEYASPPVDKKPKWRLTTGSRLWLYVAVLIVFTMAAFPISSEFGVVLFLMTLALVCYGIFIFPFLEYRKMRVESDEEYEKRRTDCDQRNAQLLTLTRKTYAQGPWGTWRHCNWSHDRYASTTVHEEITLTINRPGTGTYRLFCRGNPVVIETAFEWKMDPDQSLLVRLISPPYDAWTPVAYDFEVDSESDEEFSVFITFDTPNPLPPDLLEYWPFRHTLERSA